MSTPEFDDDEQPAVVRRAALWVFHEAKECGPTGKRGGASKDEALFALTDGLLEVESVAARRAQPVVTEVDPETVVDAGHQAPAGPDAEPRMAQAGAEPDPSDATQPMPPLAVRPDPPAAEPAPPVAVPPDPLVDKPPAPPVPPEAEPAPPVAVQSDPPVDKPPDPPAPPTRRGGVGRVHGSAALLAGSGVAVLLLGPMFGRVHEWGLSGAVLALLAAAALVGDHCVAGSAGRRASCWAVTAAVFGMAFAVVALTPVLKWVCGLLMIVMIVAVVFFASGVSFAWPPRLGAHRRGGDVVSAQ